MTTGKILFDELVKILEDSSNDTVSESVEKINKVIRLIDKELNQAYQEGIQEGIKLENQRKIKIISN